MWDLNLKCNELEGIWCGWNWNFFNICGDFSNGLVFMYFWFSDDTQYVAWKSSVFFLDIYGRIQIGMKSRRRVRKNSQIIEASRCKAAKIRCQAGIV